MKAPPASVRNRNRQADLLRTGFVSSSPVTAFAGLDLSTPRLMGIVNVTPDSFSDGGRYDTAQAAIAHGRQLLAEGADILDIGGESTRPGAPMVPPEEEQARILPVIEALAGDGALISVDTRNATTMRAAVGAGARIINDVTALTHDPDALAAAVDLAVPVILMHIKGQPQTMQDNPQYNDVFAEVTDWLAARVAACVAAGVPRADICVDPGIGFGKALDHNLTLLARLGPFADRLGCPVLLGVSRKSFIGRLTGEDVAVNRLGGSIAAVLAGFDTGVRLFRVHDVAQTRQALTVYGAIRS